MTLSTSDGRKKYVSETLRVMREGNLTSNSAKYEKLPENIRAAIAKVAGVQNMPLVELSAIDRKALFQACKGLRDKIDRAYLLLLSVNTISD